MRRRVNQKSESTRDWPEENRQKQGVIGQKYRSDSYARQNTDE